MDILEVVEQGCCEVGVTASNKKEMVHILAEFAMKSPEMAKFSVKQINDALMMREGEGSTGFGHEIAIPHARVEGMEKFLVYVISCSKGVNFEALDKKKVKLFFVILGPAEQVQEHLKLLSLVSRTLAHTSAKQELINAKSAAVLYDIFIKHTLPSHVVSSAPGSSGSRVMQLLLINIYQEEHIYDILQVLIEQEIEGATVLDSFGMGHYISNSPLFASFIGAMQSNRHSSKTIFSLVPQDSVESIVAAIETITGNIDKSQGVMVLSLDISFVKGNMSIL